jgi:hypothetical protein
MLRLSCIGYGRIGGTVWEIGRSPSVLNRRRSD